MNDTSSHISDSTSLATKRVTSICNDHSKLYEGSTPNAAKSLSFLKMWIHDPVLILCSGNLIKYLIT